MPTKTGEIGEVLVETQTTPKLEILHYYGEDGACNFSYYLNGVLLSGYSDPLLNIDLTDVDPGRGFDFMDWAYNVRRAIVGASPAAAAELRKEYRNTSMRYIDGAPDTSEWMDHLEDTPENREWWETNLPDLGTYVFDV